MELLTHLISFILHIDAHLLELVQQYGTLIYGLLFAIVFAETGLVATPFLPGDSLLFAAGALSALGYFNPFLIIALLIVAAILGDAVNYWIGHFFGEKLLKSGKIPFLNAHHIEQTQQFYEKHGGKTIILARFVPIVRTFAPFIAGIGRMKYRTFFSYNVIGGVVWVLLFAGAGFFFGNIPAIKEHFSLVIIGIIVISVVPIILEAVKHKRSKNK
jgi:membrane-associated protein